MYKLIKQFRLENNNKMWLAFLIFITYSASYIEAVNLTLKHDELPKPNWFLDQIFNNTDSINFKGI